VTSVPQPALPALPTFAEPSIREAVRPRLRVVLYLRKSPKSGLAGHEKEEISLDNQEEQLRAWAEREGWEVVAVRREKHVRYQLKARRVLMQLLDECRRGIYDLVLVFNPQRWTGNPKHDNWLDVELEEAGVKVRFLHHDPGEGEFSGVIRYMESHGSLREQTNIVQRTGDGKRKRLEDLDLPLPRPAPYGMRWNHLADPASAPTAKLRYAYLVPDPATAPVVVRLYTLIASGEHSGSAVAALLNAEGVAGPTGGPWSHSSVLYLVRNPAYKGDDATYRTRRRMEGRGEEEHPVKDRQDAAAWRVKAGFHRPVVDARLWAAANAIVTGRRTRSPNRAPGEPGPRSLLLGGLAACGVCGRPMNVGGGFTPKGGPRVRYYECSSRRTANKEALGAGRGEPCPEPGSARVDALDRVVWAALLDAAPPAPAPGATEPARLDKQVRACEREVTKLRAQLVVGTRKATEYEAAGEGVRLAAQEEANAQLEGLLKAQQARREEVLAEARRGEARREREGALFETLTAHRESLLACVPWGDDPSQDAGMRAVLRAAGARVAVWRRGGALAPEGAPWRVAFGGADPRDLSDPIHPDTDGTTGRASARRMYDALRRALALLPPVARAG
jgi:site-specific DNA recombinase